MSRLSALVQRWREDPLLGRVVRNSSYLFSSNSISMGLGYIIGLLVPIMLGPAMYGVLGMVTTYVSTVNRLLSFRMNEVVIKHGGQHLALGEKQQAAALVKAAGLAELVTSLVSYLLLLGTASLAARFLIKDASVTGWIAFYGLTLVANMVSETSVAVLQLGNHYRSQAALTLVQNIVTTLIVVGGYLFVGGFFVILLAYLAGKMIYGVGIAILALRSMKTTFGEDWRRAPLAAIPDWRGVGRFAISTNLSGTMNMVLRDSEVLWIGFFLNNTAAGYYKFAQALVGLVVMPVQPLINTTAPEINQAVVRKEWNALGRLLRRTSFMAFGWTAAAAAGAAVIGYPVLSAIKGGAYLPALPILLILLVGFGAANALFWNRPLILALNRPNLPLRVTLITGALRLALMFWLVPLWGAPAQAGLMSAYLISSIGWVAWRGIREVRQLARRNSVAGEEAA